ncbi:MAG: DMT family transporter [Oculatellaceae cyanobacterium Prado106]|jgi:drug/metabolite transporter (DMT)-like permease|nr:DMT family transporter [Oculatellaceae cyanobacterium Prado106]
MKKETEAYLWGLLGVMAFGLTLPATKAAVPLFGFTTVGLGRAVISALLGLALLIITKSPMPTAKQWTRLILVAAGVVFGFPFFSAYAMKSVPASHGAIITGLIPLFTAWFGVLLAKEKPSIGFWVAGLVGSTTIVLYSVYIGGGHLHIADVALLLAVVSAGFGYAEGTRLARELGSWRVICYALAIALPITLPISIGMAEMNPAYNTLPAWIGFLYVSLVSMFLGFFAWYRGLEMGGIAKIGQLQLLQPFVTFFASSLLFSEQISPLMFLVLAIVLASVHFGRKAKVIR